MLTSYRDDPYSAPRAIASDLKVRVLARARQCHAVLGTNSSDQRVKGPRRCQLDHCWTVLAILLACRRKQ